MHEDLTQNYGFNSHSTYHSSPCHNINVQINRSVSEKHKSSHILNKNSTEKENYICGKWIALSTPKKITAVL